MRNFLWSDFPKPTRSRIAALDAAFNEVARRACSICHVSLAEEDPYDLIELGDGLVCAECNQRPALIRFRSLWTLRADVIVRFQKLNSTEQVQ